MVAFVPVVILLGISSKATADPIAITAGSLDMNGAGPLSLSGTRGFTFLGSVTAVGGILGVRTSCLPCPPGAPITLAAHWLGNDLAGTATLDGVTYPNVGSSAPGHAFGQVTFMGSAGVAPALTGTTATLVAPFTFEGIFSFPTDTPGSITAEHLTGFGTATVVLVRQPTVTSWFYGGVLYQFEDASAIPEPTTMLLCGTGLALCALRRRAGRERTP
jgi:hypothetical protein